MKNILRILKKGSITGLLGSVIMTGFAQGNEPQRPAEVFQKNPEVMKRYFPNGVRAPAPAENSEPVIHSISFKGGSPDDLVKALREALKGTDASLPGPNVVISPEMRNAHIPPFQLQNVTLNDVFQALNNVSDPSKSGQWVLSGSNQPIWVLNPMFQPAGIDPQTGLPIGTSKPKEPRVCQVFPVAGYLSDLKIDDITTAIQTAWNLLSSNNDEPPGTLKFHKDTELLIALGTNEQLRLVKDVLTSLRQGMMEKERFARKAAQEKTESSSRNENTNANNAK